MFNLSLRCSGSNMLLHMHVSCVNLSFDLLFSLGTGCFPMSLWPNRSLRSSLSTALYRATVICRALCRALCTAPCNGPLFRSLQASLPGPLHTSPSPIPRPSSPPYPTTNPLPAPRGTPEVPGCTAHRPPAEPPVWSTHTPYTCPPPPPPPFRPAQSGGILTQSGQCLSAESPYNALWWNSEMPDSHPFTLFLESIKVNLPKLYSDHWKRAGSHALHALALLLELRRKMKGSTGCYYACCIQPVRNPVLGLPPTLMRCVPCCAVPCCAMLCHAVPCCRAVVCCAVLWSAVLCCPVPCRAVLCCAVLCCAILTVHILNC